MNREEEFEPQQIVKENERPPFPLSMIPTLVFQEIDNLHSAWSQMDKSTRLGWLVGERIRLNGLANQLAQYIRINGGFSNDNERAYASKLLEMIQFADAEGSKTIHDLRDEVLKEYAKVLMKGLN